MGVIDVETRAVGQDDVGQTQIFVGQLRRIGDFTGEVETARVAQRILLFEVPSGAPIAGQCARNVRIHDLG